MAFLTLLLWLSLPGCAVPVQTPWPQKPAGEPPEHVDPQPIFSAWTREPDGMFLLPEIDLDTLIKHMIRWKAWARALEHAGRWAK